MNRSFRSKLTYLILIAVLLAPLSMISRPATISNGADGGSAGGKLAQLRDQYRLGQAQLGQIDPTSSAVRCISFGLHGLAATILWNKADEYQKQEDWISLSAVLNQLTNVQPFYVRVWTYQSWNVSYNISSKWDDYRDKYYWVVRGFNLLNRGMQYNEMEPQFPYEIGWTVGNKIGQSDEKRDFRRLFAKDDEFHKLPWAAWAGERDNWLFGKRYLTFAQDLVDRRGAVLRTLGPEIFNMQPPLSQSLYAQALEQEGTFGEKAKRAWEEAAADWKRYGEREFPTEKGFSIRFNDLKSLEERLVEVMQQLDPLVQSHRETRRAEKLASLDEEHRKSLSIPVGIRTANERRLVREAENALLIDDRDVAERVDAPHRDTARRLAAESVLLREKIRQTKLDIETFNYEYWSVRPEMERSDDALAARELFYKATREADEKPWEARKSYEAGFALWRKILDKYPVMLDDQTSPEIHDHTRSYRRILGQLDVPFDSANFVLRDLLEKHE